MTMTQNTNMQLPDAHGYLNRVIGELRALKAPHKNTLVSVLEYLSDHIRLTRSEIGALRGGDGNPQVFSTTADELEEIVTETARAANRIMDAAESVEKVAATLAPEPAQALMEAVTSIYEARCSRWKTSWLRCPAPSVPCKTRRPPPSRRAMPPCSTVPSAKPAPPARPISTRCSRPWGSR
jgi:hypothetical protein